jgi:hypothetical protein
MKYDVVSKQNRGLPLRKEEGECHLMDTAGMLGWSSLFDNHYVAILLVGSRCPDTAMLVSFRTDDKF